MHVSIQHMCGAREQLGGANSLFPADTGSLLFSWCDAYFKIAGLQASGWIPHPHLFLFCGNAGITYAQHCIDLLTWNPGIELGSSDLCSAALTQVAISPALELLFFKPIFLWWHLYLVSFSSVAYSACSSASRPSSLVSISVNSLACQAALCYGNGPMYFAGNLFFWRPPTVRPLPYLWSLICLKCVRKERHTRWAPAATEHGRERRSAPCKP